MITYVLEVKLNQLLNNMEEFIKNFDEFRKWLFNKEAISPEEVALLNQIKNKWESLNLNDVF